MSPADIYVSNVLSSLVRCNFIKIFLCHGHHLVGMFLCYGAHMLKIQPDVGWPWISRWGGKQTSRKTGSGRSPQGTYSFWNKRKKSPKVLFTSNLFEADFCSCSTGIWAALKNSWCHPTRTLSRYSKMYNNLLQMICSFSRYLLNNFQTLDILRCGSLLGCVGAIRWLQRAKWG